MGISGVFVDDLTAAARTASRLGAELFMMVVFIVVVAARLLLEIAGICK